ncbi:MAG: hypothetical protein HQL73_12010 [Magnetococcales bacterium]|nr:hypothetical protein [Magnetococcales bacterium]
MQGAERIAAWLAEGRLRRDEVERLFVEFGGYAAAQVRDDGEIQVYGAGQCACADVLASDHELDQFVEFVRRRRGMA